MVRAVGYYSHNSRAAQQLAGEGKAAARGRQDTSHKHPRQFSGLFQESCVAKQTHSTCDRYLYLHLGSRPSQLHWQPQTRRTPACQGPA